MVMHIDDIKALANRAHDDAEVRERLFCTMLTCEGYPSMAEFKSPEARKEAINAAWALTHLPAADNKHIAAHREELVQLALSTPDTSLRRLSLVLLERLGWNIYDVRTDLLDFCLEHMVKPDEPYGVKALCIKLAYQQCRHYPELTAELRQVLLLMEPAELGAGVKHTRGKILKML